MLKKIKSFSILKFVFSILEEKRKLHIIQFNKKLQNKFGFTLEYFKKISGKNKIAEKNGKGKEYN